MVTRNIQDSQILKSNYACVRSLQREFDFVWDAQIELFRISEERDSIQFARVGMHDLLYY